MLRSGELAKLTGVSTDTLRHYERLGLLPRPSRSRNGYRLYPTGAVQRVQLVRRARSLGFSLSELAAILRVRDSGGAPCRQVRTLAARKLEQIEERVEELLTLKKHLEGLIETWDERLKQTVDGQRAGLLEALPSSLEIPSPKGRKL